MTKPILTESEYRFMEIVWDNEPLTSPLLVEKCSKALQWKKSTTYTQLKRLSDKGYLQNKDTIVTALVSREDVQKRASNLFVENTFGGSLPCFLAAFLGDKPISHREAQEIRDLIDQWEEE